MSGCGVWHPRCVTQLCSGDPGSATPLSCRLWATLLGLPCLDSPRQVNDLGMVQLQHVQMRVQVCTWVLACAPQAQMQVQRPASAEAPYEVVRLSTQRTGMPCVGTYQSAWGSQWQVIV